MNPVIPGTGGGHGAGRAARQGAYRDGKVHVLANKCTTCVLRTGNLMHLEPGRLAALIRANLDADSALICHSTLNEAEAVCRGFWDGYGTQTLPLRAAQIFGCWVEVGEEGVPVAGTPRTPSHPSGTPPSRGVRRY